MSIKTAVLRLCQFSPLEDIVNLISADVLLLVEYSLGWIHSHRHSDSATSEQNVAANFLCLC